MAKDRLRLSAAKLSLAALSSTVVAPMAMPHDALAAAGSVSGTVFRDFNADGFMNTTSTAALPAIDVGVGGVTVHAFDSTGNEVGSAVTAANGTYVLAYATADAGTAVRLEFETPTGYISGPRGTGAGVRSATSVQFVSSGAAASYGVMRPGDYSQANPTLAIAVFRGLMANGEQPSSIATQPTIFGLNYTTSGEPLTGTGPADKRTQALQSQTGSIWGIAEYGTTHVFSAAYLKRHAPIGAGGLGQIYLTQVDTGVPNATPWVVIPNAGASPRPAGADAGSPTYNWFTDSPAFAEVNRRGLGDIDLSFDGSTLYAVNLADRQLYAVPATPPVTAGGPPIAGSPSAIGLPLGLPGAAVGCNAADVHPFGIHTTADGVWVALTCTGPTAANLRGYLYRYDESTGAFDAAPAFEIALSGSARGYANNPPFASATWNAWNDDFLSGAVPDGPGVFLVGDPQPIWSDLEFDSNGDLIIAIRDRNGDQTGHLSGNPQAPPFPPDNNLYRSATAGDTLRACGTSATGWVLESNGSCGGRLGAGVGNTQGPGGGEFYSDEYVPYHQQTSLGATEQIPGFPDVVATRFDPTSRLYDAGYAKLNATTGAATGGTAMELFGLGSFRKANGVGDIEALVAAAPVEIGNRVWIDTDRDGVQDATELAVGGVTVHLYDALGVQVGTAITSATGEYYFNNSNVTGGLQPSTDYVVRFDNAADFQPGGPLAGYVPTTADAVDPDSTAPDSVDSDATLINGFGQISATTPAEGADHTFDAGFIRPVVSVGDFVWVDTSGDGIQDAGEPGIQGVRLTISRSDGLPVGVPITETFTLADGSYSFDNLPVLAAGVHYVVTVDATSPPLAPYMPTVAGAGGDSEQDSSTGSAESVDLTMDGARDATLDFGFVPEAVSVGNYVWIDTNRNGLQDDVATGIENVRLTISRTDGQPVGVPVTEAFTDSNGQYNFSDLPVLPAGVQYVVTIDPASAALAGLTPTVAGAGADRAVDSSTGSATSRDLVNDGEQDLTLDFGFVQPIVSVGDYVWVDTDGNGIQDDGATGIEGVRLTLARSDGQPVGVPVTEAFTDINGLYTFDGLPVLPAGVQYVVTIDPASPALEPYTPTIAAASGDSATDSSTGSATSRDLTADGERDATLDFGFVPEAVSVGDFVWVDTDRDGLQDDGATGLFDVRLTISRTDGLPVTDVDGLPVTETRTDTNGAYSFDNLTSLPAGVHYTVTIDPLSPALAGYLPTIPGAGGDPAADSSTGSAELGDLTDDGDRDPTLDFGFVRAAVSVGDFVWADTNSDGLQGLLEPGIEFVTLTITGPGGAPVTDVFGNTVGPAQTDGNGFYEFVDLPSLPAGQHYTVTIDQSSPALVGYTPTLATAGPDRSIDSSTGSAESADLVADGDRDPTLDFGFIPPAVSVGDLVWVDTNRDGLQPPAGDISEPGIFDVRLTISRTDGLPIIDLTGVVVTETRTATDGTYSFDNLPALPAGVHYVVTIDPSSPALAPYIPTVPGAGADRAVDSSTGSAESGDLTTAGARDATLDFGFVVPAVSVGDFVWNDTDRDGVQDALEPGIVDVSLTITGPGGAPVTDVFGVPVGPTQTIAGGAYSFDNLPVLPAGQHYTVTIDPASPALAPYIPTLTGQGTTATDSSTGSAESGDLIADGDRDPTLDFGFVVPSVSVGDFVWNDTNRDGVQDGGEPGIVGVTLTLTGPGGAPVTDVFGTPVGPTQTVGNGFYEFVNLPALPAGQSYTVTIDPSSPPLVGLVPSPTGAGTPSTDSSNGTATSGDLTVDGARDDTLDFGFFAPVVSVGDFVWIDTDRDGQQDLGESGIVGVTLTITGPGGAPVTDVNGNTVGPTQTVGNGFYEFVNLPALPAGQRYTVTVDPASPALAPYIPTLAGQDPTATDSSTGSAVSADLTTDGARDATLDFGFVRPIVSVGDFVWGDTDRDGQQDLGELGIAGVTLTITGPGGGAVTDVNGNTVGPATTDGNGLYTFANLPVLPAGQSYTVTIDPTSPALAGLVPTTPGVGPAATDSSTGSAASGDLTTNGASDPTLDFGFVAPAVFVGDFVWNDTDRDGVQDALEPGIEFVTLTITGPGGAPITDVFGNAVGPVQTDGNGFYEFAGLPALPAGQSYTVTIDPTSPPLSGFTPSPTGAGTPSTDSSNGSATSGDLTADGARDATLDFGFFATAVSVGDYVWVDRNRDGQQDLGEQGIFGVTLTLTGPGGAAVLDVFGAPVLPATTDLNGLYTFADLPPLPAGQHYTVTIDQASPALAPYIPTVANAGDPASDSSTGSAESGDLVADGDRDPTLDFGFVRPAVSVGDFVWVDTDRDGQQDSVEPGIGEVRLTLTGPGGTPVVDVYGNTVGVVTTSGTGFYEFPGLPTLPAGQSYTVTIDPTSPGLAPYIPTTPGVGSAATDSSTGSAVSGDLTTDGARDATLDFGFVLPAVSVGDFVWNDLNRDGVQGSGETGIVGVSLTISGPNGAAVTDVFGTPVGPTQTVADGAYTFSNLPALPAGQSYTVTIDPSAPPLNGLLPSPTGAGTPSTDSSNGTATSGDLTVDGARDSTLDFGFFAPAVSVGDFVWVDTNRNGVQDSGEPGIVGVSLTISGPNGASVTDVFGTPVGPTQTVAGGAYIFSNLPALPAGQHYTVTIDPASPALAPYVPTTAGAGDPATDSSTGSAVSGDLTTDGTLDATLDFGFVLPAVSVGDFVWVDTNRNGLQDSGEPGLANVTLTITGPGGAAVTDVFGNPVGPATTDASGRYDFSGLPALQPGQSYTVTIDPNSSGVDGYLPTPAQAGSRDLDSSTGSAASGDLTTNGARDATLDFGFVRPVVTVGDVVWVDTDRDGVQDPGEPGIAGVSLTITGPDGAPVVDVFGNPVGPAITDASGHYLFSNLPALPAGQHYTVTLDLSSPALADYVLVSPSASAATTADLVADGATDLSLDFAFVPEPVVPVPTPPPPTPEPPTILPATGSRSGATILYALLALAAGVSLWAATRRRRPVGGAGR